MRLIGGASAFWQGGLNLAFKVPPPVVQIPLNEAPQAVADTASVVAGGTVRIEVLANDLDPEGGALAVTEATASVGTVTVEADGTLAYTAPGDFTGTATITYTIRDPEGATATASAVVTVTAIPNKPPVAGSDVASLLAGGSVTIPVLANDLDPEGGALTVTEATASVGTVTIGANGTLAYTAPATFSGTATISYTIRDPKGATARGTATVTVTAIPNEPPVTGEDVATLPAGGTVTIPVLANDRDPEGGALTVTEAIASAGTVAIGKTGVLTYTAPAGYSGTATISYKIRDPKGATAAGTVTVTVTPAISVGSPTGEANFTIDAAEGDLTLTVVEPSAFAGAYGIQTTDLEGGPINLLPPQVDGSPAAGSALSVRPGIWAYAERHGAVTFAQQWYGGATPIAGATSDSYTVASGDAKTGLRFVRSATNTAGTRTASVEVIAAPQAVERAVWFDGTARLIRNADLAPDSQALFFFVDLVPEVLGRHGILRQSSTGNGIEIMDGNLRFHLGSFTKSRPLAVGQRLRAIAAAWYDGETMHRSIYTRLGSETGWSLDQDNSSTTPQTIDLTFGGFTVGGRHGTSNTDQNLKARVHRIACWTGAIPDVTKSSTFEAFVTPDGKLANPALSHGLFGQPRVDLYGPASDYAAGKNHGTAGAFDIVEGSFADA